jgi:hypothetical protein
VPRHEAVRGRDERFGNFVNQKAGRQRAGKGTRASANTSGPNLNWLGPPVKLRIFEIRTDEENFFLLPNRFSPERTLSKTKTRPFDLMSRRHPLSSTRAAGLKSASKSKLA